MLLGLGLAIPNVSGQLLFCVTGFSSEIGLEFEHSSAKECIDAATNLRDWSFEEHFGASRAETLN